VALAQRPSAALWRCAQRVDQGTVDPTRRERLALGAIRLALPALAVVLLALLWHRHVVSTRDNAANRPVLWTGSTSQHGWINAIVREGQLSSLVGVIATPCPDWHWFRLGWPSARWHTRRSGRQLSATRDSRLVRDETRRFTARLQMTLTLTIADDMHGTLAVLPSHGSKRPPSPCQAVTQAFALRPLHDETSLGR
jgi:hypothetical protein